MGNSKGGGAFPWSDFAAAGKGGQLRTNTRASMWFNIWANIQDDATRNDLRVAFEFQRQAGRPTDEALLAALRTRAVRNELVRDIREVLNGECESPLGKCRRWRGLAGLRRRVDSEAAGRQDTITFELRALAFRTHDGAVSPDGLERMWAEALKAATDSLWPLAQDAHFDATEKKPIHVLARDLASLLAGMTVDIDEAIAAVAVIVDELVKEQSHRTGQLQTPRTPSPSVPRTRRPKGAREARRARPTRPPSTANEELSDKAILVLRALPRSSEPALMTLGAIAHKVDTTPKPSDSTMSRAVRELRNWKPPLVDKASYRLTRAGDKRRTP